MGGVGGEDKIRQAREMWDLFTERCLCCDTNTSFVPTLSQTMKLTLPFIGLHTVSTHVRIQGVCVCMFWGWGGGFPLMCLIQLVLKSSAREDQRRNQLDNISSGVSFWIIKAHNMKTHSAVCCNI